MARIRHDLNTIYISGRLQESLRPVSRCALTAVVAPMGYGKTTASTGFSPERRRHTVSVSASIPPTLPFSGEAHRRPLPTPGSRSCVTTTALSMPRAQGCWRTACAAGWPGRSRAISSSTIFTCWPMRASQISCARLQTACRKTSTSSLPGATAFCQPTRSCVWASACTGSARSSSGLAARSWPSMPAAAAPRCPSRS